MSTPISYLSDIGACQSACEWVNAGKFANLESAWVACDDPLWLLWYAGRVSGGPTTKNRKKLVLCLVECVRLALPTYEQYYPEDKSVRACLDTTESWTRGEVGVEEVRKAGAALEALAGSDAADAADAANAASAAAYAAYADSVSAYVAAISASAAAYAAASASAKRNRVLKLCAEIVKRHYPVLPT